jgi:hypothetical protein
MAPTSGHEGGLSLREQIERYRSSFIAVVTMVVIAAAVGATSSPTRTCTYPGGCPSWARTSTR